MNDRPVRVVFDTSAVLAFARESIAVGETLAELLNDGMSAAVPVLCLAEAVPPALEAERLDALVGHPATTVVTDGPSEWRALGHLCALTGEIASASAALAAVDFDAWILTADPDRYRSVAGGTLGIQIAD